MSKEHAAAHVHGPGCNHAHAPHSHAPSALSMGKGGGAAAATAAAEDGFAHSRHHALGDNVFVVVKSGDDADAVPVLADDAPATSASFRVADLPRVNQLLREPQPTNAQAHMAGSIMARNVLEGARRVRAQQRATPNAAAPSETDSIVCRSAAMHEVLRALGWVDRTESFATYCARLGSFNDTVRAAGIRVNEMALTPSLVARMLRELARKQLPVVDNTGTEGRARMACMQSIVRSELPPETREVVAAARAAQRGIIARIAALLDTLPDDADDAGPPKLSKMER